MIDVLGTWEHSKGGQVVITKTGESFAITNAHKPYFKELKSTDFIEGSTLRYCGHSGNVEKDRIVWSNGSIWSRAAPGPRLSTDELLGTWQHSKGGQVAIKLDGETFSITNSQKPYFKEVPAAKFVQGSTLHYCDHTGNVEDDRIVWSNGSVWSRPEEPAWAARGLMERPDAPPVVVPSDWSTSRGTAIIPAPELLGTFQELLDSTWRVKYTRDRKGESVPTGTRITNVLRVENHATFEKYWAYLHEVRARRPCCPAFEVATDACAPLKCRLDPSVNEMYLFHGTNPVSADAIARNDFRLDKAGSAAGTMFGDGIYLAEHASKSDEYAKEGDGIFMGQCAMLVCRAVAGHVCTVQEKGDASGPVESGDYDTICGDRLAAVGTFREMVFFCEDAVCTEFILLYTRTH